MTSLNEINYDRIAAAIEYVKLHFKEQPSLDDISTAIGISAFHFQRLFLEWAGVSPKKFIQYLSVEYAKKMLMDEQLSLLDVAYETGLSGTSRLHDLFVNIEGMTPGEFKNGGENLVINYSFATSPFGKIIVASTRKGICHLFFVEDEKQAFSDLKFRFPNAQYQQILDVLQQNALRIFQMNWEQLDQIKLHLKGTDFQLKVWTALLKVPQAKLASYSSVAKRIEQPKASRAVGTAIACNPIAIIIPCHRVIRMTGEIGDYMWGDTRKSAIIAWEVSKVSTLNSGK